MSFDHREARVDLGRVGRGHVRRRWGGQERRAAGDGDGVRQQQAGVEQGPKHETGLDEQEVTCLCIGLPS